MTKDTSHETTTGAMSPTDDGATRRVPIVRAAIGGVLMGLANLVPGVSGGTMILVMGLYDDFVSSIADVTRLRFTRRGVVCLGIIGGFAAIAIGACSGAMHHAVTNHRSMMYALFVGMTLGGAPLLMRMLKPAKGAAYAGVGVGLALMIAIAVTRPDHPPQSPPEDGQTAVHRAYGLDVAAGALGMSAMVLPGISGAYMLLLLDRYDAILEAVSMTKDYVTSLGREGSLTAICRVLIPVAIGAGLSLVLLSNLLKWLLHRHPQPTLGLLLGILFGSVFGIWPFESAAAPIDYLAGAGLAAIGFLGTLWLSRLG